MAEGDIRAPQVEPGVAVVGVRPKLFPQLGHATVRIAGFVIGDLPITLGDPHLGIELQRDSELLEGLVDEALSVVQHTEVVVRAGIGGIDAAGKRPQGLEFVLRVT